MGAMIFSSMQADCVNLLVKYYKEAKRAVCLSNEEDDARSKRDASRACQAIEKTPSVRNMEVKSKTRAGGRCRMCFDPLSIQKVLVVVFFCCHGYHTTCLMDSTYTNSSGKKGTEATSQELYEYDDDGGNDNVNDNDSELVVVGCDVFYVLQLRVKFVMHAYTCACLVSGCARFFSHNFFGVVI